MDSPCHGFSNKSFWRIICKWKFYIIIWNYYMLTFIWPMSWLIIWLDLLCACTFVAYIVVHLINCYKELLYTCVYLAHVEASCSRLLWRIVIYLCSFFLYFKISFKLLCGIIDQCRGTSMFWLNLLIFV